MGALVKDEGAGWSTVEVCMGAEEGRATARRTAHRVMAKKKRKGSDRKHKVSRSAQGKQRQDRRDGWATSRRQVWVRPRLMCPR
ncbi:hypothetical protein HaLaN_30093, partial [Haematococcus lacustris]